MTEMLSELSFGKTRLAKERKAMEDYFPEANLHTLNSNKEPLGWRVGISINGSVYDVLVTYHSNFPYIPPNMYIVEPYFDPSQTPHMYLDGNLSLPTNYEWELSGTAATGVTLAANWLQALEVYQAEGVWPEDEWSFEQTTANSVETVEIAEEICGKGDSTDE